MATGVASNHFDDLEYVQRDGLTGPWDDITTYPLTIAHWVNAPLIESSWNISIADSTSTVRWFTVYTRDTTDEQARVQERGTNANGQARGALVADTWYFLAGVFTSGTSRTLYIDGVDTNTNTDSENAFGGTLDTAAIGRLADSSPSTDSNADLCYFHVYNRALSIDEINEIMWKPYSVVNSLVWAPNMLNTIAAAADANDLSGKGYDCDTIGNAPSISANGPPVFMF